MNKAKQLLQQAVLLISAHPTRDAVHKGAKKKWAEGMNSYMAKDYARAETLAREIFNDLKTEENTND